MPGKHNRFFYPLIAGLVLLGACADTPPPKAEKKEPPKPPEPVAGRYAFHQMYAAARGWAGDIQPLRLNSVHLSQVKSETGKSGAWQATFVSQQLRRARSYTYSVVEAEGNLHKGVFAGPEESWGGPRGQAQPFIVAALKVDSDEAYKTSLKKGAEYAKKHPDVPVSFLLEKTPRFPNPAWRVIWGESVGTSNFSIFVDASSGEYLQTMR